MPMAGGPADKVGNRYERRWTVSAMPDVIAGVAESLRIEVPGTQGAGAEFRLIVGGHGRGLPGLRPDGDAGTTWAAQNLIFASQSNPDLRLSDTLDNDVM